MTTRLTQPLDAEEAPLADQLARLGEALPPPTLDSRIRAEAHAALRGSARVVSRPVRRWGGALAAVLALGVGIKLSLEPTPLQPGVMPSDSAVSEQAVQAPITTDQAERAQSADANAVGASIALEPKQDEQATPQEMSASRGRADVQSASISQSQSEQPVAAAPSVMSDAPQAARAKAKTAAPSVASPPAQAFPSASLRAAKEEASSSVGRSEPPPSPAPALAPPAATALEETDAPLDQQEKRQAVEVNEATALRTVAADAKAAKQASQQEGAQLMALEELIDQARQLHSRGDATQLQRLLALIARDYPEAELPDDVQAMLDAERPSQ